MGKNFTVYWLLQFRYIFLSLFINKSGWFSYIKESAYFYMWCSFYLDYSYIYIK